MGKTVVLTFSLCVLGYISYGLYVFKIWSFQNGFGLFNKNCDVIKGNESDVGNIVFELQD